MAERPQNGDLWLAVCNSLAIGPANVYAFDAHEELPRAREPPRLDPISSRFRHLADWRNEEKYGRPDFFLCDNTPFSFVPPGKAIDASPVSMACRRCTCRDVASFLRQSGHDVIVDRDDFSIVKFNWPQP